MNTNSFQEAVLSLPISRDEEKIIHDYYILANNRVQLITKLYYLYLKILNFDCSKALEVASESALHF